MVNAIIFSKDRGAQLDLLLRSIDKYAPWLSVSVLYNYSSENYKQGYDVVQAKHKRVTFLREHDFKADLLSLVDFDRKYIMFFVDDDVFTRELSSSVLGAFGNPDILTYSIRLDKNITFCQLLNKALTPVSSTSWNWGLQASNSAWGYPMSLDGNIFRNADICPLLSHLEYHRPNPLENQLQLNPPNLPVMACGKKSCLINNPLNRVQDDAPNPHSNTLVNSEVYLNGKFLNGDCIDLKQFHHIRHNSVHYELPIKWIKDMERPN